MAGINNNNPSNDNPDPFNNNDKDLSGIQENPNDIDDIFEGTLEKIEETKGGVSQGAFYRPDSQVADQIYEDEDITPVKSHPPPKPIDFLSTLDDKQQTAAEEDPDEAMIREQLRLRNLQHKPMLGLDSDDDSDGAEGEGSKANRIKSSQQFGENGNCRGLRRPSENRQSQSQLFLKKKKEQMNNESQEAAVK